MQVNRQVFAPFTMIVIATNPCIADAKNSQRCFSSVSYVCRNLHHSTTRNYTTEHKLTLPKILNIIAFNPSLKRGGSETLASINHRTFAIYNQKCNINNNIDRVSPDTSPVLLETNKPLIDRGLRE